MHLALAVSGVQRSRNGARQRGGVIGDAKFPAVRQKDADDLAGTNSGGHQSARRQFHHLAVRGIGDASLGDARGVDDRDLGSVPAAGIQDHVMNKLAFRIIEKLGPQTFDR